MALAKNVEQKLYTPPGGLSGMPFTARELRYEPEKSYPILYAYLHRTAQRYLGSLKYDAFEVDTVIGHVVEQLVRLGLLGGGDSTKITTLDQLTEPQFYTFLSRSVRNKAIDRLRKRRLQVSSITEIEAFENDDSESPLNEAVESIWGSTPFSTPEEITMHLVSQQEIQHILLHCLLSLQAAPNQLQAVLQELHEVGADELCQAVLETLNLDASLLTEVRTHQSQHKDHAHKKLRVCLQKRSTNLTVQIALRLTQYTKKDATGSYSVDVATLQQDDFTEEEVRMALQSLATEGFLAWEAAPQVVVTAPQMKRLSRFYRQD